MVPPILTTPEEFQTLLDKYDTFLCDCDGVIYHGPVVVPGVPDVLKHLRANGKRVIFVTNNASKSRRQYKATFDALDIEAPVEDIFGSAYASAVYISQILKLPKDKKVYVIGESGIEEELAAVGIQYTGGTDPADRVFLESKDYSMFKPDPSIGAVLCGFDMAINYVKISKAFTYLRDNKDCHFIITNEDATFPTNGTLYPGSGSMSAPLRYALKREPTVIGKPNSHMMDAILAEHHLDPKRTLMVGDNLTTDILFGINSGIDTLLVMGGVTNREEIFGPTPSTTVPTYVAESFGDLSVLAK